MIGKRIYECVCSQLHASAHVCICVYLCVPQKRFNRLSRQTNLCQAAQQATVMAMHCQLRLELHVASTRLLL